jgi:hypothetical protein
LLLSVKKFFCRVASCPRKIFTERLPELIEPSSRLTTRLRTIVQAICAAFNAKGGARLGKQLGIHLSRKTFLHSLLLLPTPPVGKVKAVGIDDFAWKRGKRYGTVIIDLETHDLLDLLPDREAESVKQWLLAHPEIAIVSRDRAGAYAEGATEAGSTSTADRGQVACMQKLGRCCSGISYPSKDPDATISLAEHHDWGGCRCMHTCTPARPRAMPIRLPSEVRTKAGAG